MEGTELTLRWEKFGLSRGLHEMLATKDLVDVTIACQGEFMQAHKTVLAACSAQFRKIFLANPCQHPVIFMQDSKLSHLQAVLNFMYTGEATVLQHELAGFMKTAEALKVSGLTTPAQGPGPVLHQKKPDAGVSPPKKTRTSLAQPWVNLQGMKMETPGVYIVEPGQLQASVNMDTTELSETERAVESVEAQEQVEEDQDDDHYAGGGDDDDGDPDWFDESAKEHDEGNTSQPSTSAGVSSRGRKQDISNTVPPMWVWNAAEEKLEKVIPGSSGKSPTKTYNCNTCNRPHRSKNSLRAHIYKYHSGKDVGQEHKCSICEKVYKLKGGLLVHMENVHGKNAVSVTCIDCGKQYKNKMAHYKHVYAKHRHRITNKAAATIIITEAADPNFQQVETMEETI